MKLSEETDKLFQALAQFQKDCPKLDKDAEVKVKNKQGKFLYSFKYATLGNILTTTRSALAENGLSVTQSVGSEGVRTIIGHESGQYLVTGALQIDLDGDEQDQGSSITYKKRYQLSGALRLDADLDDDGNKASGNVAEFQNKSNDDKPKKNKTNNSSQKQEPKPKTPDEDAGKQKKSSSGSSGQDPDEFIENCDNMEELISWWKDNKAEYGDTHKQKVAERLDEIQ